MYFFIFFRYIYFLQFDINFYFFNIFLFIYIFSNFSPPFIPDEPSSAWRCTHFPTTTPIFANQIASPFVEVNVKHWRSCHFEIVHCYSSRRRCKGMLVCHKLVSQIRLRSLNITFHYSEAWNNCNWCYHVKYIYTYI